ncbi:unnamed protein product [Auanema sp. JU1783]|nr:unnamed protein product [Auanema sp. JU1783]
MVLRFQRSESAEDMSSYLHGINNALRSENGNLTSEDPNMQLDWIKRQGKKATPLAVHLLMIVSVGAYAVFGAVVMRKLESKPIAEVKAVIEKRHSDLHINPETLAKALEAGSSIHRRRRRHNDSVILEKVLLEEEMNNLTNREKRTAAQVMRSRRCVISAIKKLAEFECSLSTLNEKLIKEMDKCYHISVEQDVFHPPNPHAGPHLKQSDGDDEIQPWSFMDSLLFAFTVITTIGYGNVAPKTFAGRLFVVLYGLVGIPFTLLAIADLGKFLSEIMADWTQRLNKLRKKFRDDWIVRMKLKGYENSKKKTSRRGSLDEIISVEEGKMEEKNLSAKAEEGDDIEDSQAIALFIVFLLYIAMGGLMLASYEPDMDFFKAVYFNFVTLTSIGLGDIVPRSETYMVFTIVYIAIGLALTTMAIEIAADTLKKLHYYGRKIENVGSVAIWFGGKKMTMKALVKNLGDQFNLPTTVIKDLDLDNFVDMAIKVEEGQIETLRPPPFEPDPEEFTEPPKEPTPEPTPSPSPEPKVETPPRTPTPEPVEEPPPPEVKEESPPPQKPRALTAAELAAQKRRAYSEEAWRRYQEYQKQWKKFRQTQKVPAPATGTGSSTRSGSGPGSSKGSTQPGTPEAK